MFTNTINLDRDSMMRKVGKHFETVFKSYEEGVAKPEKAAFLKLLKRIKATLEERIFVDDVAANVEAAKKLGIQGIVFTSLPRLKKEFEKFGIK